MAEPSSSRRAPAALTAQDVFSLLCEPDNTEWDDDDEALDEGESVGLIYHRNNEEAMPTVKNVSSLGNDCGTESDSSSEDAAAKDSDFLYESPSQSDSDDAAVINQHRYGRTYTRTRLTTAAVPTTGLQRCQIGEQDAQQPNQLENEAASNDGNTLNTTETETVAHAENNGSETAEGENEDAGDKIKATRTRKRQCNIPDASKVNKKTESTLATTDNRNVKVKIDSTADCNKLRKPTSTKTTPPPPPPALNKKNANSTVPKKQWMEKFL